MNAQSTEIALDTYKMVRKKFIEAGDSIFGPGFLSMAEYYFMKKTGYNPFAMLFSEPKTIYDEWVIAFKGEEPVRKLVEKVAGPGYVRLLENIKRNDGLGVWDILYSLSSRNTVSA